MNEAYAEYFKPGGANPCRTCVGVASLVRRCRLPPGSPVPRALSDRRPSSYSPLERTLR